MIACFIPLIGSIAVLARARFYLIHLLSEVPKVDPQHCGQIVRNFATLAKFQQHYVPGNFFGFIMHFEIAFAKYLRFNANFHYWKSQILKNNLASGYPDPQSQEIEINQTGRVQHQLYSTPNTNQASLGRVWSRYLDLQILIS